MAQMLSVMETKLTRNAHPMPVQCWPTVCDDGPTVTQFGTVPLVCGERGSSSTLSSTLCLFREINQFHHAWLMVCHLRISPLPANMRRWPNIGLLLAHCLRRCFSSNPTLGQRLMFSWLPPPPPRSSPLPPPARHGLTGQESRRGD